MIACDVDDIEMRWLLTLMVTLRWDDIDDDDDIEMRWLLTLMMTLRWDDVNVDDVIMMDVCCVCTWGV